MDKLVITPGKVRGLGNLLTPKGVDDLILYNSEVTVQSNGSFVMDYTQNNLVVYGDEPTIIRGQQRTVVAYITDDNGSPVNNATAKLYNGSTVLATATTNSTGYCTLKYTISTEGTYRLHVGYDTIKSRTWEVKVVEVYGMQVLSDVGTVWNGSSVTFTAEAWDSEGDTIDGIPIHFKLTDGSTTLRETDVVSSTSGSSFTYSGKYFSSGKIKCTVSVADESDVIEVPEIYYFYQNTTRHISIANFTPNSLSYDSSNNLVFNAVSNSSLLVYTAVLPGKFDMVFDYKGSLTGFTGIKCGIDSEDEDEYLIFSNNKFTLFGSTFSGTVQTNDTFRFNYDGTTLVVQQIRNGSKVWTRSKTVSFERATFKFDVSSHNGYKINNLIGTYKSI